MILENLWSLRNFWGLLSLYVRVGLAKLGEREVSWFQREVERQYQRIMEEG